MRRTDLVKCKFLIAWAEGSDGACGEATGIKNLGDLYEADENGNKYLNVYEYEAPAGWAWEVGAAKAFEENFTGHDTVSTVKVFPAEGGEWVAGYNLTFHD